jgi:ketosteroid isomerase-like protein
MCKTDPEHHRPFGTVSPGESPPGAARPGDLAMGIANIDLDTTQVEVAGGVAIETGRFRLQGADGADIDNGKYLVVWREEAGQWRMHRDIWNTNRPVG